MNFRTGRLMACSMSVLFMIITIMSMSGTYGATSEPPVLRVGSELEFPPYAFVDESGQPAGFSVDLIKAVANAMGLSIKISTGPWDTVWNGLVEGRLDVLPIVAKLPERQSLVDFSLPHTETFDAFFVRKASPPIQNIESAKGKEIVVMHSDAAHHALMQRHFQGRLILVDTIPHGLSLIASGKHDAFLCSKLIGTMSIKKHGLKGLAAGPPIPDYKRVFSFAVKKGDAELLEKLNQGLLIIKANGEYGRIYEKWLTADDPWRKFEKYIVPAIAIVVVVTLIVGFWLVMLQLLVKKRTRELAERNEMLRLAREGLEEKVSQRTAELTRTNVALQTEIAEREKAEEALRENEKWLVADLEAMKRLQKIGTLFVREGNLESVLSEIVEAAVTISGADFGNIQLLDPKSSDLHVVAQRGFPTWWLDFWNKVAEGQGACGTALERGERVIVEDVEQSPIFVGTPALEIQLKAGVRAVQSTPLVSRSGKPLGMFSTHYKTPHRPDDRALGLLDLLARQAADLIEYEKAEEALREAYERTAWLARLPEQNPNPVIRASADGTVLYCNPACANLHGWKSEVGQVLPKELFPLVSRAMAEEDEVHEDVQLNGRVYIVWVEPFPREGYANIYGRDITERKRAEERIAQLTKLYVVLSRVNETIVRTSDEEGLFREVCCIVAEEGGFPLVWVGLLKGRQIEPTASHGSATDYLKEIRVEVDGALGTGPTGTCVREDRPVINDDFDTNPSTAPWRERALRFGFRASGAFPLHCQGRVIGALTIYAPNPGAFDADQVSLLEALSADISYALDALQQEKLRSEAEDSLRQRTLELQQLTETLEMRVQERTQELAAINEELRVENEERLRIEIDLRESENRLRELSSALLSAQERERKLIAGEIHDSLGASLAAAKFKVESALKEMGKGNPRIKAALESVVPIVHGTIEEARRIQMSLRPSMLDDLGILATINWFCRQYESIYPAIRIKKEIDIQEQEVPESLKIVIYRILQEALNNIAKHSKASVVLLYLQKAEQTIQLVIRDSGQGFDLEEASSRKGSAKGLGLDSMRERAELSGGSFLIESSKGAGTVIRATWPIEQLST